MQLIPRYLVNDQILVISNDAGFNVEYRPVYQRTVKIYRGVDNTVQFRMLNADQKPVDVFGKSVYVSVFDRENTKIIERAATVTDDGTTASTKGTFTFTFTDADTLNVNQQYLSYTVWILESDQTRTVTYNDRDFGAAGTIYLDGNAMPGPKDSISVTNWQEVTDEWFAGNDDADKITAHPGLNGNEALHTVAVYNNGYAGDVEVQATLDNQITGTNNWTTVSTITLTGSETEPVPANFNGVFSYLRFKTTSDPTTSISKILVRN